MEETEVKFDSQPTRPKGQIGPRKPQNKLRNIKRSKFQHSADIVFTKGTTIKTLPSLTMQLSGVTEPIIGLQYVWEYRSPSKSVPPHYQCKICNVSRLQHDMLAHIKGWKHSLRYMMRAHPTKVPCDEEEATKDPVVRKKIKEASAEAERTEGRGKLKVILKEPCEVAAFKGLRTAIPKPLPPPGLPMGPKGPYLGGRFSEPMFQGEYPPHRGPFHEHSMGDYGEMDMGGYPSRPDFPAPDMNPRRFPEDMGPHHGGGGNGFTVGGRSGGGGGMGGLLGDGPSTGFTDEFRGNQMGSRLADRPVERPGLMGAHPEGGSLPSTLLSYLDTFRIENEDDAQIVLKVTQKLTDVLMEYRLRSVSGSSTSLSSPSTSTPRNLNAGDRYSGNFSGPSRYSGGPSGYYN